MNESMRWLDKVRGNDSIREAARKIGTTHATLSRQAAAGSLSFEFVRDLARAYSRAVLPDLLAMGHLSREDVGAGDSETALHAASEEELVAEVARRLGVTEMGSLFDQPASVAFANVHQFPNRNVGDQDEDFEEVASETISPRPEGETDADYDGA
ncbi:hypothetical protein [Microbacterium gilvum]|uniref:XRE family transcriptional regulator n=1 Tax=Microbacterium gilvum TaxID=1336204 RepID=A0ABP8ZPD2_9MICO